MTKENTKSRNKQEKQPDSRWWNKTGGRERRATRAGEKENDRNREICKEKQHQEMRERGRGRGRMWSSKEPWASHH